jgi:hypothetical protein
MATVVAVPWICPFCRRTFPLPVRSSEVTAGPDGIGTMVNFDIDYEPAQKHLATHMS